MIEQENELKSLLTEQPFEGIENTDLLLAQTRARAKGFALATEGIAVVSDFKNNECHIYAGRFGQTTMNLPQYTMTIIRPLRTAYSAKPMKTNLLNVMYSNYVSSTS